jgi:preprotein translocase subunit SecB
MTAPQTAQSMPIVVHAQYVKDLSFENPGAPDTLRTQGPAPEMSVEVNVQVKHLPDPAHTALFEVVIQFRLRALRGEAPVFLIDLDYALMVSVDRVPENHRHAILLTDVPKLGFPFARQILADATQNGGFPPLLLTPIDFTAMYVDRFAQPAA